MYPQRPTTAADALRNPQRPKPMVQRQGAVMGGGMGGGVKPMGGSPYPPAPRPMQPQRPRGVPPPSWSKDPLNAPPSQTSSFDINGRPVQQQPQVKPATAFDAIKPIDTIGGINMNGGNPQDILKGIANAPESSIQMLMRVAQEKIMAGDPNAQEYMLALIQRRNALRNTGVPQPYTPLPTPNIPQNQY